MKNCFYLPHFIIYQYKEKVEFKITMLILIILSWLLYFFYYKKIQFTIILIIINKTYIKAKYIFRGWSSAMLSNYKIQLIYKQTVR